MTKEKTKKNRKKKAKGKKLKQAELQQAIFRFLKQHPKKRYNPRQIARNLEIANSKDSIYEALKHLAKAGKAEELEDYKFKLKPRRYELPSRPSGKFKGDRTCEGYVDMTRSGAAYIVCERKDHNDIFVAPRNLNTAMHGDRVKVLYWHRRGRFGKPEGKVIKVLQRASEQFIGTLYRIGHRYLVVPEQESIPFDIAVAPEDLNGAKERDLVVVKIKNWENKAIPVPRGTIVHILSGLSLNELIMQSIFVNNGFELNFPEDVLQEAEAIDGNIREEEIQARRDMRTVTTFTIDPEDAKDFDDALSFRELDNGHVEVGIHIADVSHYVQPGSALDKEAGKRSTSVYLVDRVLPMLPERLSNELCSLRPNEDKLTFSAVFELDKKGKIHKQWFGRTVIHSNRRFSYEQAQQVIDSGKGQFVKELRKLNELAKLLRKTRFRKGAINFDTEEVRFRLNEEGVPQEAYVKVRLDAHMLIEEFMLLANRSVATYISRKGKDKEIPFVYRIHDLPNEEKVAELARFAAELGFKMDISTPKAIARSFNKMLKEAEKNPALKVLEPIAIRTMAKAEYSTDNIGHYGLAFSHYTHFTSPIRRYADVLVHRILFKNLHQIWRTSKNELEEQCRHISLQERKAQNAERESIRVKQAEYLEAHLGESFRGRISGIISHGFFVQLIDNLCEGMVSFAAFNEPFDMDDGRLKAVGRHTGRTFRMGDEVQVIVVSVDILRHRVDMVLDENDS